MRVCGPISFEYAHCHLVNFVAYLAGHVGWILAIVMMVVLFEVFLNRWFK